MPGRAGWDDEQFRRVVAARLDEHAGHVPEAAREAAVAALPYRQVDLEDLGSLAAIIDGSAPVAAYLALPPGFPAAVSALGAAGLGAGSRSVVEKSLGEDLDTAAALNRLLGEVADERDVFRVDRFLAMSTVQNLLSPRCQPDPETGLEQHSRR